MDIYAWKYRKHRRVGAIYWEEATYLPICQYLSPLQESNTLRLTQQMHRLLPQTCSCSLPPGPSSTTSHCGLVGRFLLHPSSSLWSPQSLSPSHCHWEGIQVHSPRALTAHVKWLRPQVHSGLPARPGSREKVPVSAQLQLNKSPFQGAR